MKKKTVFLTLLNAFTLVSAILFSSCDSQSYKARKTLRKLGIQEVSTHILKSSLETRDYQTTLLQIEAGALSKLSSETLEQLLINALLAAEPSIVYAVSHYITNASPTTIKSALGIAIQQNDLGLTNHLLKKFGTLPESLTIEGKAPLTWSLENQKLAMTLLLLDIKIEPSLNSDHFFTALEAESPQWLLDLIYHRSSLGETSSSDQGSSFHQLLLSGSDRTIDYLLTAHPELANTPFEGRTPLEQALVSMSVNRVELLLKHGADIHTKHTQKGSLLLQLQHLGDHPKLTLTLINRGLSPNDKDSMGLNTLDIALTNNRAETVKLLLQKGITPSSEFTNKALETQNLAALKIILENSPFDLNAVRPSGDTLLIEAIKAKNTPLALYLIEKAANPHYKGREELSPLTYAVVYDCPEIVTALLAVGVSPSIKFTEPRPAFIDLLPRDSIFPWFLRQDTDLTLFMLVCELGNLEICNAFVENNASITKTGVHGFEPKDFAIRRESTDITRLLLGLTPEAIPHKVEITLSKQQATLSKAGEHLQVFDISSGREQYVTPPGKYVITDKKLTHISSLYEKELKHYLRLNYSELALHEGLVPGYPSSRGPIHLPSNTSAKIYHLLEIGDLVIIKH